MLEQIFSNKFEGIFPERTPFYANPFWKMHLMKGELRNTNILVITKYDNWGRDSLSSTN
jgi:hypothetical protein